MVRLHPALLSSMLVFPSTAAAFEVGVATEVTYDDNVFRLTEKQKDKVDAGSNDSRYDRMVSSDDVLVSVSGDVVLETKRFGRKTRLSLQPGATVHVLNTARSHLHLEASVEQKLWQGGEAFLEGGFTPSRFKRNYFSDGQDQDLDGDVSGSEKEYRRGVVTEGAALGGVRSKVGRRGKARMSAGVASETWAPPFRNRDERALLAAVGGEIDLGRLDVGIEYGFVSATTAGGEEVSVTNGIRAVAPIDRSHRSHEVQPEIRVRIAKRVALLAEASYRRKEFTTTGGTDPFRDRVDTRVAAGAGIRASFDRFKLTAGYEHIVNRTRRPNDADASGTDELDYTVHALTIGASARF